MPLPAISSPIVPVIEDVDDIPDDLETLYDDGCFFLRVPLGESEDGRWLVAVDVGYRETTNGCPCEGVRAIDFAMFGYEIIVVDQVDTVFYQTMNPQETQEAIPAAMRSLVLDIADFCYLRLLQECNADYIYRITWLTNPSENALKKHERATETLVQAGYSVVKEGTDEHGCKFWLLGKDGVDHSNLEPREGVAASSPGVEP
jgi:hypothetical protein